MHKKFEHAEIEARWQSFWKEKRLYDIECRDATKNKEYVLVEWPYPSGNLHIGHWFAFAVVDIYVRAHRMQGRQVLFPIGFDAFGLPAENAAIKNNLDPKAWTDSNIEFMKKQLESMGNAFSWDTSTSSTDPDYYRWTQWMFTEFFKKDIAYRGKALVNWCPGCNTVIANEQVLSDGTCERSGHVIERRDAEQWMLRITDYADRLIDDLDALDWPEHIKEAQRQWIGRSRGARLTFRLSTGDEVDVFTTRPDTLFGATYLVLAPEHEFVLKSKESIKNFKAVAEYILSASQKNEIQRTKAEKEKTGVLLEGISATNPATKKQIPVFIADYVLKNYGTGAIMAVPAHDERDFEFAKKYELPITQVISSTTEIPYSGQGILLNSESFTGMDSETAKKTITESVGGVLTNTYRLRDWSIGRQRYWGVPIPIVYDTEGKPHPIPEEHLPWHLPTDVDFKPTGEPPLAKSRELKERVERIFGVGWTPEVETMDTFVDSSWYFLRYCDKNNEKTFSSFESQKNWMPIDVYFGGAEHTTMHLLYSRFWQKALYDLGLVQDSEPYKKRINRGLVLGPDGNKMSKSKGNVIDPDEQVRRLGADTVKMYLAFMGPYGEAGNFPWDMGGIAGLRRFLERVYGLSEHISATDDESITALLHKTIAKVGADIELYKFNTAISALMVFVNSAETKGLTAHTYTQFLRLLAPFAPHLTEELWHIHGHTGSIHEEPWPVHDVSLINESAVTIAVQVNGKVRGTITLSRSASEHEAIQTALELSSVRERVSGTPKTVVYKPGRILNLIVNPEGT